MDGNYKKAMVFIVSLLQNNCIFLKIINVEYLVLPGTIISA